MKVIVSGGGTGGHIYPALSIIKEIKKHEPDSQFLYVGTANGLEADIVHKAGIPFRTIDITGFKRKISLHNLKTVYRFIKSTSLSKQIIKRFQPDIVIGTGGYVCGPVVYAASRLSIPTLIHEQNVIPGLANAFLARHVSAVAVSFEGSTEHFRSDNLYVTGNPRASEVVEADGQKGRESLGIPPHKKVVLIVGGSRGAEAINRAFVEMSDNISQMSDCHFVYVTGQIHYSKVKEQLADRLNNLTNLTVKPFIYNMPDVLAGTDLIVNRAGASFLAEITALGLPSILIPSPYVTNNHQEKNARWLEREGASKVILEKELTGQRLWNTLRELLDNEPLLDKMRKASLNLGKPEAANQIYQLIKRLTADHAQS
ncbi:UDP-N-acetylglucosamine--N-acetylmuramyl-(pentapeptide) pyrophosphoryl-undecaprenol N-acetylglucosamine transferase [Caldalkalibacillus thermarum TA2.A1]|uniref:UDP-N-acetylglucosamine--N-acetylmuramyl-(pentapeptide) pyrophosphoryl-undecaprenol N-acetylglucosamine transferase n=1 Tax=Caldalkalibacillus thermarum (strain TA2.A1) TaxID=986075 RepID=F5L900_CALTT|nr:undecaprenyldiphospho-muramoylpentapeptide beta-N-acetylglucosaminyltransferase [Caldalkalibacillus thermarum]EGL82174.1 UDP-N-acetylglucosamine--N-acetylmuramyl-(pentapeptide) pyrophosphoryl-undecaprenol N-acetylglucosamine transferase [Caldalkalibacillus thermarum TA2.A1]QZT33112.1 undecaprenyldiphospho-muramoylpentapeptide beta-N-acetylglucosaminyltransferase [Caldalkalibacillus thermarum TA2.A1]